VPTVAKKVYRFKVLRGTHREGGKKYNKGDIVNSASDLRRHNSPGAIKFQPLGEDDTIQEIIEEPAPQNDLDSMDDEQLKMFADAEEVDISSATTREEIIALINTTLGR